MIQNGTHPRQAKGRSTKRMGPGYFQERWNRQPGFVESPRTSPKHIQCQREEQIGTQTFIVTYTANKKGKPKKNNNGNYKAPLGKVLMQ